MPTTEHTINDVIAQLLRKTRRAWHESNTVRSENTGMIKGSNARPDILVIEPNVSPVAIETELLPALRAESEARSRLGVQLAHSGRVILSSVAVRLPAALKTQQADALLNELSRTNALEMALFTGKSPTDCTRWPESGWITGSIADLSLLVQSASVPPSVIDEAADLLVQGVSEAAALLGEIGRTHPGALETISRELRQEDGPQTHRMAATILANAFMFHISLAGGPGGLREVRNFEQLRAVYGLLGQSAVLGEWRKILTVNYWPIFDIARRILAPIPAGESVTLIDNLSKTATKLLENRLMRSHDLTGAVFQRLIVDRKFLAAYYTTPASAALLIGLAITPQTLIPDGKWGDPDKVTALRIADFACGTGTLLSTAYQRVSQLHELAGGDSEAIHPQMMATALVGCDVLPAAAHLTASMLAGAHPMKQYQQSSILTVAYGKQPNGSIALGSLDLLNPQSTLEVFDITAQALEGGGEKAENTWWTLPNASFDAVIMNPPFTRATNHEGQHANVPNPMFAAFGSSKEEQDMMAAATERLTRGTSAHGNAGEASIFLALADRKIKPDGTLALVMPLTLLSGPSWEKSRGVLYKQYTDLILVTIAGEDGAEMSFSADTGMGECLVVGRKAENAAKRATFVVLSKPPAYPLAGMTAAEQIRQLIGQKALRRLEDGPIGGNPIRIGEEVLGYALDAPLPKSGGWNIARIHDLSLAQTAYQLIDHGRVWLPAMPEAQSVAIPVTRVQKIGKIGPVHRDVRGSNTDGSFRGPFELQPLRGNDIPTYPILWAHNANRERTLMFEADNAGIPVKARSEAEQAAVHQKVARVWETASHCHVNLDFRFNSQSTAMQYTKRKTIGGRAWLSVQLPTAEHEKALVLWANSTLGLLARWWHSNKQQSGRGNVGKEALATLPVLDVTALSAGQLAEAVRLFDELCDQPLRPINEIHLDTVRHTLDTAFGRRVLGLPESVLAPDGPLALVRLKLSREPSIRGSKQVEDDDD